MVKKTRKKKVKGEVKKIKSIKKSSKVKGKKIKFLSYIILFLLIISLIYFYFPSKDILEIHPELKNNAQVMDFLNKFGDRSFKEQVVGDFLYITIISNSKDACIIAIEDVEKNIKQTIVPKSCDAYNLEGL